MTAVALLLFAAACAYGLAHALRVPVIPVLLVTGVLLAIAGGAPEAIVNDTLILGITILLFVTGIELSPRRTRTQRRAARTVGALQFTLMGALGLLAAMLLGYDVVPAAYLALALTASSTLVVV
jgi:Kef-type K+ transport system membrane component KefB